MGIRCYRIYFNPSIPFTIADLELSDHQIFITVASVPVLYKS